MNPKLSIKNLSHAFSSLAVLQDISLQVKRDEFVSIIGPSGCGKSTLFYLLSGIEEQQSGTILLDNKEVKNRKGKFGYMPQDASLLPWKTVLENVMLGDAVLDKKEKTARANALELLQKFGLADFADAYPATLSGGMQQRVALLRTVLFNSSFLLLDEPFGALDALTRHEAQVFLLSVCSAFKTSVLFVTHDIQEAILLSDRIYVMSDRPGRIVKEVKVGLKRPRKLTDLTSPQAGALEKQLLSLLLKGEQ